MTTQAPLALRVSTRSRLSTAVQLILAAALALSASGHLAGTFLSYRPGTELFVWSMAGVLAAGLLAVLNVVRIRRERDVPLAWICAVGCGAWAVVALSFNAAIHAPADFRGLMHFVASGGLAAFAVGEALSARRS